MSTLDDREQVALDIFLAFERPGESHFSAHLLRLIQKADSVNRERLARSYPLHVEMFREWWDTPNTEEFYERYNVNLHVKDHG